MVGMSLVVVVAACSAAGPKATESPDSAPRASPTDCPVTRPDPGVAPPADVDAAPPGILYGNNALWVGLPPGGEAVLLRRGGVLGRKFMWWRLVPGQLSIAARRIDAPAPAGRGIVPTGYGDSGFQASGIEFPTEGCWEVTGSIRDKRLTFVIRVREKQ